MENKELFEYVKKYGVTEEVKQTMYKDLLEKSGHWGQIEMLTEELGEFLVALNKLKRTKKVNERILYPSEVNSYQYSMKYFSLCSELADLEIMLEQMRNIFSSEAIDLSKERKLQRQIQMVYNDKI